MAIDAGMMSFVKLLVSDAERSARFYEGLGFERVQAEPPFIHLRWGESADVYLVSVPTGAGLEGRRGLGVLVGFRAGEGGINAVASRALAQGVDVEGPTSQPWHTREIVLTDPDGYRLNFIEPA
ncbi:VOC family protein [Hyalangium rubrum]|uniref:VOC family protein n=1 Tax=Hyalangium rubrum TaxID=3103134 RepID=A0ABU5HG46_9BACT|nr:VOC family protein [Hyalangium sp. s54d21]MDY7232448.1 VOC family protein [Hyalangium sp. s54d21]